MYVNTSETRCASTDIRNIVCETATANIVADITNPLPTDGFFDPAGVSSVYSVTKSKSAENRNTCANANKSCTNLSVIATAIGALYVLNNIGHIPVTFSPLVATAFLYCSSKTSEHLSISRYLGSGQTSFTVSTLFLPKVSNPVIQWNVNREYVPLTCSGEFAIPPSLFFRQYFWIFFLLENTSTPHRTNVTAPSTTVV
ncbi:hypothetical protein AX774_g104 [Zancudomyces culisetae]|uniref:Uncharacterized protein n=1 Tax=Zancudomyces culisetae TaxID=1213189 RepID=A0A1R1PZH1_ZANCU|nr:hypothetical protein AX774_g104 [Zancudomyces culisetae]|eukprot:OMH86346.1 hypothetical protein AX774_g104 [Zancudomyces culisetae]